MLITIAIPTYNNASTIAKTVESCLQQTDLDDVEVLVVNNSSTDDTEDVLKKYNGFSKLRVLKNSQTASLYENHNICLSQAKGKYVLFCHSDDYLDLNAVKILKSKIKSRGYPDRYIVWGYSLFRDYYYNLQRANIRTNQLFAGSIAVYPFLEGGLTCSGTCYSKDMMDLGGFFVCDHKVAPSDGSTMVYLAMNGYRFEMMEDVILFRFHASTATSELDVNYVYEGYVSAYHQLCKKIGKARLEYLISLSMSAPFVPINFFYLLEQKYPNSVQLNKLIIAVIKNPYNIFRKRILFLFFRILLNRIKKTLHFRLSL